MVGLYATGFYFYRKLPQKTDKENSDFKNTTGSP